MSKAIGQYKAVAACLYTEGGELFKTVLIAKTQCLSWTSQSHNRRLGYSRNWFQHCLVCLRLVVAF